MASIIDTTRIVDLPTKASLSEGDVFVVDNENGATSKIPATAVSGSSTAGLVAEEYSDAGTYEVGEYCIHVESGIPKLYKCTTAIATAEAWTPAHWEGTDAGTEITDLNQNLTELPKVQSGTCPSGSGEKSVTFPRPFSSAPNVVVTPFNTATPTNFVRSCTITEVTASGFKFYEMASNGSNLVQGTDACYWMAVGV